MVQPQFHLEYGYKWILVHDLKNTFNFERKKHDAPGEHVVTYVYIDHMAGLSMKVRLFCEVDSKRRIDKIVDLDALGTGLTFRLGMSIAQGNISEYWEMTPLTNDEIVHLGLPDKPKWINVYAHPEVEPLRSLEILHSLRAPGFPDDIKFGMFVPGLQVEQVWGRLERRLNETLYECILLNAPHQDFGVKAGEHVVVLIAPAEGGIASQFIAPLWAFQEPPPTESS